MLCIFDKSETQIDDWTVETLYAYVNFSSLTIHAIQFNCNFISHTERKIWMRMQSTLWIWVIDYGKQCAFWTTPQALSGGVVVRVSAFHLWVRGSDSLYGLTWKDHIHAHVNLARNVNRNHDLKSLCDWPGFHAGHVLIHIDSMTLTCDIDLIVSEISYNSCLIHAAAAGCVYSAVWLLRDYNICDLNKSLS
jgi:hypothetical protein